MCRKGTLNGRPASVGDRLVRRARVPVCLGRGDGAIVRDMTLSDYPVRASIGVTDIQRAVAFYEGVLGLVSEHDGPSADIEGGARFYKAGQGTMLNVFETPTAGGTQSTVATWYVNDIDAIVDDISAAGAVFAHYEGFDQDERGIGPRAGGGRIAWVADPDGNTIAIEADD